MSVRRTSCHYQQGASMLTIMVLLAVVIFLGLFAFRVGPAYFENFTINKIAEDTAANAELMSKPKSVVYQSISTAYRMNNLYDVDPRNTIEVSKHDRKGYQIKVKYERRTPLFGNIDVVTHFDKAIEPGT